MECQEKKQGYKAGMEIARLRGQEIGSDATPPHIVKKALDAYLTQNLSVRDLAKQTAVPKSTRFRLVQGFKAGKIDREGLPLQMSRKGIWFWSPKQGISDWKCLTPETMKNRP
jgi:hypothetical protein